MTKKRTTKALPTECPKCEGLGQQHATRTIVREPTAAEPLYRTVQLGSGCEECLGTGQIS